MSRWDSRTVPASARRAGRAAAGVVSVVVSWACAVMPMRLPSRRNSSLQCHACSHMHEM